MVDEVMNAMEKFEVYSRAKESGMREKARPWGAFPLGFFGGDRRKDHHAPRVEKASAGTQAEERP